MGQPWTVVDIPSVMPSKKTEFCLSRDSSLQLASWLLQEPGIYVLFFLLPLLSSGLSLCRFFLHVLIVSAVILVSAMLRFETDVSLKLSTTFCSSQSGYFLFHIDFWDLGGGLWQKYSFMVLCSSLSLSVHCLVWVSVLISICYKKRLLWWKLNNSLTYGYSNMSLVIVLLLCLFSRIMAVVFPLEPLILSSLTVSGRGSISWNRP